MVKNMKKVSYTMISILLFLSCAQLVNAGACDVIKKPLSNCTQDQTKLGSFSEPSIDTINRNNCTKFITRINEYCSTACSESASTSFPKTIGAMSVDQYDAILGGNHFQWDEVSIVQRKECKTTIDYESWEAEYNRLEKAKTSITRQLLREWHQFKTDRVEKTAAQLERENSTLCRKNNGYSYSDVVTEKGLGQAGGPGGTASCTAQSYLDPEGYSAYSCTGKTFPGATTCECYHYTCKSDYKIYIENGERVCRKPKYTWGDLHRYTKVTYHDSTPEINIYATYCSNGTKPYWDTGAIDIYWKDTYKKLINNINNMIGKLRQCNTIAGMSYNNKPSVAVTYKDPTKNYTSAKGQTINYEGKLVSSKTTTNGSEKASNIGNGLIKVNCKVPANKESMDESYLYNSCTTTYTHEYDNLRNKTVSKQITNKYEFSMPKNIYRYVLKGSGESVNSDSPKVTDDIKNNKRYIDIGYPNYPVHFTTPTGTYPISLTYKNIGSDGKFVKSQVYNCTYKVINRVIPCVGKDCDNPDCVGEKCDRCYGSSCDGSPKVNGINVIYRPISLTNPFPGESGKGRSAGINWTNDDIKKYITNNRNVKQNSVYNEKPLYSFTLTANAIKKIKAYNATTQYDDFKLKCSSKYGKRCSSNFLKSIRNYGVTVNASQCYNSGESAFYSCAKKPNQDNVKCYLDKDKKTKCVNCSVGQGHENDAICKEGSGK